MKLQGIAIKGWRIDRAGKLIREVKHLDVSARLRQRASKKIRPARKGQA